MRLAFVTVNPVAPRAHHIARPSLVTCSVSSPLRANASVAVVGAGLVGLSVALELANRTGPAPHVTVVSRDTNEAASRVAAGMLAPTAEVLAHADGMPEPLAALGQVSRDLYPEFLETVLPALSRADPSARSLGYRSRHGFLLPLMSGELRDHQSPRNATWLTPSEAQDIEPALSAAAIAGAWYVLDDAQIDARLLYSSLIDEAQAHPNITFLPGTEVESFRVRRGTLSTPSTLSHLHLRDVSRTNSAKQLPVDHAVLTTGAWTKELMPALPVTPVRGQIISLSTEHLSPSSDPLLSAVIYSRDLYVVPKPASKRILIGATMDPGATYKPGTALAGGVASLLSRAIQLVPALADLPVQEVTSGLRPAVLPDRMPLIGASPDLVNVTVAAGHYRNGVLLLPVSTKLTAAHVVGGGELEQTLDSLQLPTVLMDQLDPGRFTTRKGESNRNHVAVREQKVKLNNVAVPVQGVEAEMEDKSKQAMRVWHVQKDGTETFLEKGRAPECFTKPYGDVEEERSEPANGEPEGSDSEASFVPNTKQLPDAYDDVLVHQNDSDPEESGRRARAKNRCFGVNSTRFPGSSISDEEWAQLEAAEAAGAADAELLRPYLTNSSDSARLSTLAEERRMEDLDEEERQNYVSSGYY